MHDLERLLQEARREVSRGNELGALPYYKVVIENDPTLSDVYTDLFHLFRGRGEYVYAEAFARKALSLHPNSPPHLCDLANVLYLQNKLGEAHKHARAAYLLQQDYIPALHTMGLVALAEGEFPWARKYLNRCQELDRDNPDFGWDLLIARLTEGDLSAMVDYDLRFRRERNGHVLRSVNADHLSYPAWDGETLGGKRIFVYYEQGDGDTIQFCRYLRQLTAEAEKVFFHVQPGLRKLIQANFPDVEIVTEPPQADYHVALLSIPGIMIRTSRIALMEPCGPYITKIPAREIPNFRPGMVNVGIAWRGNKRHRNDVNRSTTLDRFFPLFGLAGVQLYSLQVGSEGVEVAYNTAVQLMVRDLAPTIMDYQDTAGFMDKMNLIITVDTSIAHLAGAMGKPVFNLIPYVPDWRWGREGNQTVWYPTMRLFRQREPGDWGGVFDDVRHALRSGMAVK